MSNSREGKQKARLIAKTLSGSWRPSEKPPSVSQAELDEVTQLLIKSGAGALAWWRIRDSDLATSDAAAQLHQTYRLHRLEGSLHTRRLQRVLRRFRAAGIEPVLVKGRNVARLYPEPGLRHYMDIDLCVARECFAEASLLVASLGEDTSFVDLHEELDHLDVMPWQEFFKRSQVFKLDDTDVRAPCPEDHLRLLCVHWLRHGAWRPAGLCDVAVTVEALPDDFDWQRCLGPDPVRANWVACTIKLAQELLGAEIKERQATSGEPAGRIGDLPLTACRLPLPTFALPRWLIPAVLRQWSRTLSPMHREPALPSVLGRLTSWQELTKDLYSRLDQPVRATVALHGRFNNWPRLPYQLGELLLHSSEAPRQLGVILSGQRT